ncbi:nitric oxide-associated protein 1 isoform X1 [Hylaeus volcanicus]|uniref:nitric oxide-associated protein 1 isoform X1 n=1 Tax=Hylaeus volcanicus TaxID=313075 RepID=UPI0023B7FE0F|nr:nitric oxide-associated protein 1 isoform X1 [Hylaeus volcanicus]
MEISKIRFLLSQLNVRAIRRSLQLRYYSEYKVSSQEVEFEADPKVVGLREKLLYCDYLDYENVRMGFKERRMKQKKLLEQKKMMTYRRLTEDPALSVFLNAADKEGGEKTSIRADEQVCTKTENKKPVRMPYSRLDSYETTDILSEDKKDTTGMNEKYKDLYEKYLEIKKSNAYSNSEFSFSDYMENNSNDILPKGELWKVPSTWMSDFEQYDESITSTDLYKYYGTPDPFSEVSSIPCGGCGALLHCKDPAIPGYLPSELMSKTDNEDLKLMICQRCHFLKFYNASLEVNVSIEDYPKLLSIIKRKKCAIILIVDLTDFPCSIWPDLKSIMHPFTPIFLVGNKIDLLPRDCPRFFDNVREQLLETLIDRTGIKRENVTHVALTSAKTGWGIEELINKLQLKWRHKGDVYLVGCTNVGKSSIFNMLLNSDYCKVQALDLVQRATTSPWPGTTLNLLKFPILNPTPRKGWLRMQRLQREQPLKISESKFRDNKFKETRSMRYATLQGDVGKTFSGRSLNDEEADLFIERSAKFMERKLGLDESREEYRESRWCYDTPGTVQRDQILDLLTTDELLTTLPQIIIAPRTFLLRPKETVFVAGMGRLDYVEGDLYIRCTLFTSRELPITICHTVDADQVYDQLLETEAFVVPTNDPERLKRWPKLKSKEVKITGINREESAADVVLSSIGWIAITCNENENVTLTAWTPEGRGIHVRSPALLKKSVIHRGVRIHGTPMYSLGRKVYVK